MTAIFQALLLADLPGSLLTKLDADKQLALIVIVLGCLTGVICTIVTFTSNTITSIHRRRLEVDMKREMIDRGMTADEIVKVIEAAPPLEDGTQRWIASWGRRKR